MALNSNTMSKFNLIRKTALITGANEGLGFETALQLSKTNCKIIMADKNDLTESKNRIVEATGNDNVLTKFIDLASFTSVKSFAANLQKEESHLNILINNAGVFGMSGRTEDGFDPTMQINYFAPYLLTHLLKDLLKKSSPSRILFVTSSGAFFHNLNTNNLVSPVNYPINLVSSTLNYYNSKFCAMIASKKFANNLKQFEVTSNCFHPGMMNTKLLSKSENINEKVIRLFTQDVSKGAKLAKYLATSESISTTTGEYFEDYKIHQHPRVLDDQEFCSKISKITDNILGLNNK